MKKFCAVVMLCVFVLLAMTSCKKKSNLFGQATNGLYLYNDMSVEEVMIYPFATAKYDATEYRQYLDKEIAAYNNTHNLVVSKYASEKHQLVQPVSVVKCEVKSNELYQHLLFATVDDYMEYAADTIAEKNGSTVVTGDFSKIYEGMDSLKYYDENGKEVSFNGIVQATGSKAYRFIGCDCDALLYGEGNLVAYSAGGSYDATNNCVKVPAGSMTYAIYKVN